MESKSNNLALLNALNWQLHTIKAFTGLAQSSISAIEQRSKKLDKIISNTSNHYKVDYYGGPISIISGDPNEGAFQWGLDKVESSDTIKSRHFLQALCLVFQTWEEIYRKQLVNILGEKELQSDIFGDLRLLRNAYLHGNFRVENPTNATSELKKIRRLIWIREREGSEIEINELEFFAIIYALSLAVLEIGIKGKINFAELQTIPSFLKGAPQNVRFFQNDEQVLDKIQKTKWYSTCFIDELLEYEASIISEIYS